ncbi:MAG TPA: hypothetical protein VJ841_04465 [Candidatus Saccharimonadales bacterium]|nr:hypothetical protein [Candidatus Saccharimonadales bacterium]
MNTYETTASFETQTHEKSQEQSPEAFINSLTIFDAYVDVTPEMATQPEYQMTFDAEEQQLAEGLRGMLEKIAAEAMDDHRSVSINGVFDLLDEAILASKEAVSEDIRDQLLLVATKMRYNLQVRFNKGVEEVSTEPAGLSTSLRNSVIHSYNYDMSGIFSEGASQFKTAKVHYEKPVSDSGDQEKFDQPQAEAPRERNYYREAQNLIDKATGGVPFEKLDPKEQGKVRRRLAREYHPDNGSSGDEALFKEIGDLTADTRKSS